MYDSKNKIIWNKYGSCGCHFPVRSMEKFTGKRTGSDRSHCAAGRGDAGEQSAVKETQAREEAVKCWCDTQVRRYSEQEASYAAEEKQFEEKQREREEKERRRRERKRREEKRRQEERQILERIVEAEAGDQDLEGRILVANVILNRVHSKHFPDTIKGVVFANRAGRYQFSPVSNGRYYRVTVSDKTKRAVKQALAGKDISKGALYFMCRSASDPKNVAWFDRDLTKVAQHGCHEFFK